MKRIIAWLKRLFTAPQLHSDTTPTYQRTMDAAVRWDRTAREFKANGWRY